MKLKHSTLAALTLLLATTVAQGTSTVVEISETFTNATATVIPDGDLNGLLQSINPTTTIGTLTRLTVTLETTGGWNGDLYAYLWHDGLISVLLNRIGRTSAEDAGSPGSGLSVSFEDVATTDIHQAMFTVGNPLIGTFQPDGRFIHPDSSLDSTGRTSLLDAFIGSPASGEYRLFIADVATGDVATLTNWSITLTGTAVPEPSAILLSALALPLLLRRRRA